MYLINVFAWTFLRQTRWHKLKDFDILYDQRTQQTFCLWLLRSVCRIRASMAEYNQICLPICSLFHCWNQIVLFIFYRGKIISSSPQIPNKCIISQILFKLIYMNCIDICKLLKFVTLYKAWLWKSNIIDNWVQPTSFCNTWNKRILHRLLWCSNYGNAKEKLDLIKEICSKHEHNFRDKTTI